MSRTRITNRGERKISSLENGRADFQRDWDRIIFCNAFRRLHDKTQVFPLPDDDIVHSRLTHSLEVAAVGRSLGTLVGGFVCEQYKPLNLTPADFGDVVAAACLAHDIGNPPLGHAGEDAIGRYFRSPAAAGALKNLSKRQLDDFKLFEGNAQGFRIVTRLQLEDNGGLCLTTATLGAFMKYPREAGEDLKPLGGAASKKYGVFQADIELATLVATELGLHPYRSAEGGRGWCRHPLAYVVEAADDICNSILDLEDGVRLRHLSPNDVMPPLQTIAQRARKGYSKEKHVRSPEHRQQIGYLRAVAINALVDECYQAFKTRIADILDGKPVRPLVKDIVSRAELEEVGKLAATKCYHAPDVLQLELAGYDALGGLLERFVTALVSGDTRNDKTKEARLLNFLAERTQVYKENDLYAQLLRVTDYLSGMTDRYALSLYRRFAGIDIPGRVP